MLFKYILEKSVKNEQYAIGDTSVKNVLINLLLKPAQIRFIKVDAHVI